MKKVDFCIIGGGIAGTSAAETIRKHDSKGSILILSSESHRLYSRVMLSKAHYILKESPEERIYLRTLKQYKEQNIELQTDVRVEAIHPEKKRSKTNNRRKHWL